MNNWNRIFLIILLIVVVQSFGGVANAQGCSFNLSPTRSDLILADGATGLSFAVDSDDLCYWRPTSVDYRVGDPVGWITVSSYGWGEGGDGTVVFDVDPNPGFYREGSIVIEGVVTFTVRQESACTINYLDSPNAASDVFVTYPACGSIVRVGQNNAVPVFANPGTSYEGLVYGPDEMLYALDPTRGVVNIFDPTAENATEPDPAFYAKSGDSDPSPYFGRFNQRGDLLVTDKSFPRVFAFENTEAIEVGIVLDPTPKLVWEDTVATNALAGVTIDANGDLQVVNRTSGTVLRFQYDASCHDYDLMDGDPCRIYRDPGTQVNIGLANAALGLGKTSNRDVFIAADGALLRYDVDGDIQPVCAAFPANTVVVSVDPSANDTHFLSVILPTGEGQLEGQLWEVPFGYDPCDGFHFFCQALDPDTQLLATFGAPTGAGPVVGDVALPFTGRQAFTEMDTFDCTQDFAPVQGSKPGDLVDGDGLIFGQSYNFFDAFVEFKPLAADAQDCTVKISSQEYGPIAINDVIINPDNTLTPSRPLVLPGDNGRMRVFDFMADDPGSCPAGEDTDDPRYERAVSAFFTRVNPKLALCHEAGLTVCDLQQLKTLDLEFGIIPGDGRLGGVNPKFSEAFLVDQVPVGDYDGRWCGVDPPVNNEYPWLEANSGSVVPIDIKPVLATDECGDKTIPNLVAVLAVYNADNGIEVPFEDLTFTGNGSASEFRAIFHAGNNPKKPYSLNWNTVDRHGDPLPAGLYKLNIIDDTAATNGFSEIYFPPQTVYVRLK